tara:strand:- start:90 stop:371 length:282 start_codon:yes stop_codon:yes gene_type:complete
MKEDILNGKMFWSTAHNATFKFDKISNKLLVLSDAGGTLNWQVFARIKHEWKTYFELEYYKPKLKFFTSIYDHKLTIDWVVGQNLQLSECILV